MDIGAAGRDIDSCAESDEKSLSSGGEELWMRRFLPMHSRAEAEPSPHELIIADALRVDFIGARGSGEAKRRNNF